MISVIIPTLNEESTIGKMLCQFSPDLIEQYGIELIVCDGGSSDQTVGVAKQKAHKVLHPMSSRRQTIGEGRNLGARSSTGDVLFFFNADVRFEDLDRLFGVMLERLNGPKIAAATCPVYVYPEEQTILDLIYHEIHNLHIWFLNLLGFGTGRGECHVIKRESFFEAGGYDDQLAAGEDFDLFRRLSKLGKIKFVWSLKVYESPRRYRKLGYLRVTLYWFLNALSILLFRRSYSKVWEPIR